MMLEIQFDHRNKLLLFFFSLLWFCALIVIVSLLSMEGQRALRFNQKILICVPKMNEGLMGLERHEGEQLMTEFSFLGELTL